MNEPSEQNGFTDALESRMHAMEAFFGSDFRVRMGTMLHLNEGPVDIAEFDRGSDGSILATYALTGNYGSDQLLNTLGEYEFAIHIKPTNPNLDISTLNDQAAELLRALAAMSKSRVVESGDTAGPMELPWNDLTHILFYNIADESSPFLVMGESCGMMMCIGITDDELRFIKQNGHAKFIDRMKSTHLFPYTNPHRKSIV